MPSNQKIRDSLEPSHRHQEGQLTAQDVIEIFSQNIGCVEFQSAQKLLVNPETYLLLRKSSHEGIDWRVGDPATLFGRPLIEDLTVPEGRLIPVSK